MTAAPGVDGRSSGMAVLSRLIVDIDAVVANWRLLADRSAPAECAAVMKADGYGLGVRHLAPALAEAGCRSFFVAHPAEGIAMRRHLAEAGCGAARVFILHGLQEGEAGLFRAHDLCPVLSTERQIRLWQAAPPAGRCRQPCMWTAA